MKLYCAAGSICAAVGALSLAATAFRALSFIKVNYLTKCDMKKKYGKAGNWAVVTGASEGIGLAMSMELARRGFNVCVIARTKAKLDAAVEDIRQLGVEGMAIPFDFCAATPKDYDALFRQLDTLEIAVLINNVGINYVYTNYIDEVDVELDANIVKVNCEATVRMTKYVVPRMKAKRAGAIVMLGSFCALTPTPMMTTYSASKAFDVSFGTGLHYELKQFGIDVLAVTPNIVVSRMTQGKSTRKPRETFMMVNAAQMACQTLDKLGTVPLTAGHRHHALFECVFFMFPIGVCSRKILAMSKDVKRKVEAKSAQKKAEAAVGTATTVA